ncbi:hypothetical protein EVAR_10185_1 [Eumeta japonica]|uniref:Uncharacterized protein n=1 Tax=Eumeta variegata TaxID=151549 RepID=A0A4C1TGE7_EUMVA|nr:hypothetical protein EVAR_10185_1 [Eumeta japonica]
MTSAISVGAPPPRFDNTKDITFASVQRKTAISHCLAMGVRAIVKLLLSRSWIKSKSVVPTRAERRPQLVRDKDWCANDHSTVGELPCPGKGITIIIATEYGKNGKLDTAGRLDVGRVKPRNDV